MSYEDVINIINAHYGWSMDTHEPEYKGEIKEKMQAMKQLVKELNIKAEAFDECEAKAKAWDKLMFEIDEINDETAGKELPSKITMAAKITALSNVMKAYESGESE